MGKTPINIQEARPCRCENYRAQLERREFSDASAFLNPLSCEYFIDLNYLPDANDYDTRRADSKMGRDNSESGMTRSRAPSQEGPSHSRQQSLSYQEQLSGVPQYYHGRGNSVGSIHTRYEQLGDETRVYGQNGGGNVGLSQVQLQQPAQPRTSEEQIGDVTTRYRYYASSNSGNPSSPERGRQLHKKYEFQMNDGDNVLSPVPESAGLRPPSHVTTMTDIINGGNNMSSQGSRDMSRHESPPKVEEKRRPMPLNLDQARAYAQSVSSRVRPRPVQVTAARNEAQRVPALGDGSSSVYTSSVPLPSHELSSDRLREFEMPETNVLQHYNDWSMNTSAANGRPRSKTATESRGTLAMPNAGDPTRRDPSPAKSVGGKSLSRSVTLHERVASPFTPLTPYLMGNVRKSKTLFGEKGWLEDTAAKAQDPKKPDRKKNAGFLDSVKKTARRIVCTPCFPFLSFP